MNTVLVFFTGFVVVASTVAVVVEMRRRRREQILASLLATFGPPIAKVQVEPREVVAWASVAATARAIFPDIFKELDAAHGARFPFPATVIEDAHARWTTQWLVWEREHDLECKRQASRVDAELASASAEDAPGLHSQLAAIEQEKLQRYQERYEEYVRVGRAMGELES